MICSREQIHKIRETTRTVVFLLYKKLIKRKILKVSRKMEMKLARGKKKLRVIKSKKSIQLARRMR